MKYNNDLVHYAIYLSINILVFILLTASFIVIPLLITNSIYLKYSYEKPSFYRRNKDNIIAGAICAIFGTVIGGLIVYFITKNISSLPNP